MLKPRTALQKRDAVYKPLIPLSQRVMASTDKTSFLNKRVERFGKDMDEQLGEKVEQKMKAVHLEGRMGESEPRSPKGETSTSISVKHFYLKKRITASPHKFFLKQPMISREFSEGAKSMERQDQTINLTPSLNNDSLSASSELARPSEQSKEKSSSATRQICRI